MSSPKPRLEALRPVVAAAAFLVLGNLPAGAWDAAKADCKHSECNGGTYADTSNRRWSGNTHLWIVNRALELLSRTSDPVAAAVVNKMNNATCRPNWELGIWDGDEKWVDAGSYPGSHFYNASGRNWVGDSTSSVTYRIVGNLHDETNGKYPNARKAMQTRIRAIGALSTAATCYELGVALHYMGDMTQPMHTSSMSSATTLYEGLHPLFEEYVGAIHNRFPLRPADKWDGRFAITPDWVLEETSKFFNPRTPVLLNAIKGSGIACTYGTTYGYTAGWCFHGNAGVDAQVEAILRDAYQSMASFIYTAAKPRRVSLAAGGNEVYLVGDNSDGGTNYLIRRLNQNSWDLVPGSASTVSVDGTGAPWVVTSEGAIYRRENNNWVLKPGQVQQIGLRKTPPTAGDPADAKEGIWAVGYTRQSDDFWIHKWGGSDFGNAYNGAVGVKVAVLGVEPWLLKSNGSLWTRNALYNFDNRMSLNVDGQGEQPLSDIACGTNTCWAIGTKPSPGSPGNFNVLKWNGKGWTTVPGEAVAIAVDGADVPWVVTAANAVWKQDSTSGWRRMN